MLNWLVLLPLTMAAVAFLVPSNRWRPWLLPLAAAGHLALVCQALTAPSLSAYQRWLMLDPLGKLFLGFISLLFFICSWYAPPYLALRSERPNRVFCACLLVSLAMMTLIVLSHHLGLMWVAVEATTLVTAPSVYFNHNPRSLEATWKYLLICSVGIALALLGSFFLAYSSIYAGLDSTLLFDDLVQDASRLSAPWLHAAFVLLFVGYGTKMGLAPMHTWKPDTYGEAPGLLGALLAGGLTSCAFLAVLRFYQITQAAGHTTFVQPILVVMGLVSMGVAAVFMVRQRDIKRLLAYSSVEHMGILVFGLGLGKPGIFAALLHVIHNGLTKGLLFLSAGNIHRAYGSKFTADLKGVVHRLPFSGATFLIGFFAITGSPPFAPFVSQLQIIRAAFDAGHYLAGGLFCLALLAVFLGMGSTVVAISLSAPAQADAGPGYRDGLATSAPILAFLILVVWLGIHNPAPLQTLLADAVQYLEMPR